MPEEPHDDTLLDYIDVYHAAAVLQAISAYARLEYEIDELIWQLAAVEPEIGACLTAQYIAISPRMDALISLAHAQHVSTLHIHKLNKFKETVGGLAMKRHRLVHDPWSYAHRLKKLYRLEKTAKAKLVHDYKPVTEEELKAIEAEIKRETDRFRELRSEILHAFWSSPYRPPGDP